MFRYLFAYYLSESVDLIRGRELVCGEGAANENSRVTGILFFYSCKGGSEAFSRGNRVGARRVVME